jgi:hypothetical protein
VVPGAGGYAVWEAPVIALGVAVQVAVGVAVLVAVAVALPVALFAALLEGTAGQPLAVGVPARLVQVDRPGGLFRAARRCLKSVLTVQVWRRPRGFPHVPHVSAVAVTLGASFVLPAGALRSRRVTQTWPSGLL